MRTDKIRKYVLPNIPYLFIGWACLKMGTAYRLAAGANFGEKLLGLMQTIGVAFADFSPGLNPADWLVGIVGAVGFRLLIYVPNCPRHLVRKTECNHLPGKSGRILYPAQIAFRFCPS